MTVGEVIKKLEKIDKDKMCIHRDTRQSLGWANLSIVENDDEVTFCGDYRVLFED